MNMPATSIRDLVIHENDLVIGSHGRSIWIMDDITPLRNMSLISDTDQPLLMYPAGATRVRFNMFSDTPLPPEEPTGENPPDGAVLDYYLPGKANSVKLEIFDLAGNKVHWYASDEKPEIIDSTRLPHPTYWIRPDQHVGTSRGHHRFIWNLRYKDPVGARRGYAIAAVQHHTSSGPVGPFVHPGIYHVRLTVDGVETSQPIRVRMDPRVSINEQDLQMQTDLSLECYQNYATLLSLRDKIDATLNTADSKSKNENLKSLQKLRGNGLPGDGDILYGSISESELENETIVSLQSKYLHMLQVLQSVDARPTDPAIKAIERLGNRMQELKEIYESMN
jgi:hypothetical protein